MKFVWMNEKSRKKLVDLELWIEGFSNYHVIAMFCYISDVTDIELFGFFIQYRNVAAEEDW